MFPQGLRTRSANAIGVNAGHVVVIGADGGRPRLRGGGRLDLVDVPLGLRQTKIGETRPAETESPRAPGSGQASAAGAHRGGAQRGNTATGCHGRRNGVFLRNHWAPPFGGSTSGPDAWQKPT